MRLYPATKVIILALLIFLNLAPLLQVQAQGCNCDISPDPNCCKACGANSALEYAHRNGCSGYGSTCYVTICENVVQSCNCFESFVDNCTGYFCFS